MNTLTVHKKDLKKFINDTVREQIRDNIIDILTNDRSYLKKPVLEAIEDIALANAIEEGMQTEIIDKKEFEKKLRKRIILNKQ
jgi:hypothetical protein